ncbi:hypothetical protein K2173_017936 [Erythroxylum novogranatense]|uniref:F-box domain-containing protein n=1 Tax=Erythroxylum novogranatense TaxID=1862640 RepID=A0AAV8TX77_9ROSI|nr:hypothetical protein K2173_017936 [Erythroxylum novogranatense]
MSNLPPEMIAAILCRLPAKELVFFRCVSKPWCSLIDAPNFIRLHLRHSLQTSSNLNLILKNSTAYSVSFDSLEAPKELDHPLMCYNHCIKVLGSCNGLLCISNVVNDVALWNPSTRKHLVLPSLPFELKRYYGTCTCRVYVYGFGYDSIHDDYKVVRIAQFVGADPKAFESEVKVYSLRQKSWKRIKDMPYFILYPGMNGVFANGALHWVVSENFDSNIANIVVSLNLATLDYSEVLQPEPVGTNFDINLGVLSDCLCLMANFRREHTDVWVMNKYSVKEPWTKLFSVAQHEVVGILRYLKPLAYSKSGNEVLVVQDDRELFCYDIKHKQVKNVPICGAPLIFEVEIFVESLVPPHVSRTSNVNMDYENEEQKDGKKRDDFLSEGFKLIL